MTIPQSEADRLVAIHKKPADPSAVYSYPSIGGDISIPLVAVSGNEHFLLDVARGRIRLDRCKSQVRFQTTVCLCRLEWVGAPHTNPDAACPIQRLNQFRGRRILSPHIHWYVENFDDRWAEPFALPVPDTFEEKLELFSQYVNIIIPPTISGVLI